MKHVLVLACALLCVNGLMAQHSKKVSPLQARHNAIVSSLLQTPVAMYPAMKTTSVVTQERVIAQSTRDNTANSLTDSVKLGYTTYHTSAYDYNTMIYAYNYPYASSPMFNNDMGIITKPQVQYDTFLHWTLNPNDEYYGFWEAAYATYNSGYSVVGYVDLFADSATYPNMVYTNKFTAAKNIDTAYGCIFKGGALDSAFKQFFSYNGSNQITEDSTYEFHLGTWHIVSKSYYTYDVSSNLIQIDNFANDTDTSMTQPLVEQLKYVNTYDASHRLLTVASSFFTGTALSPYIRDTFGYSGTYTFHNSWREYQYDPINGYWAPMTNMTKAINSLGEPDTVTIQGFDSLLNSWVPQTFDVISYNSFKDPDTLQEYDYNFTAFPSAPNYTTVYYYGTFVNHTGVSNMVQATDRVNIFPNPAGNSITIAHLDVPDNTRISVALINVSGQIVSRTVIPWQNNTNIAVGDLVPGAYGMVIQDGSGNVLHRQTVVKQ
jgi:type IX secretion system substrate protein